VLGTPCPECGAPLYATVAQARNHGFAPWVGQVELDHVVPVAVGGQHGKVRLIHRRDNRIKGAKLGRQIQLGKVASVRPARKRGTFNSRRWGGSAEPGRWAGNGQAGKTGKGIMINPRWGRHVDGE
jgi:hypothetical protein